MCSTRNVPAGRADRSQRDGTVRSADGFTLFWRAWSPTGSPEAVVGLVHGVAEHSGRYPALVDELIAAGVGVYAIDLRGHGRSTGRRASVHRITDYLTDIDAMLSVIAAEHPTTPCMLAGYSLGGLASTLYALDHQQQLAGLVLAAPALGIGQHLATLRFATAQALATAIPRLPVLHVKPDMMMQDPAAVTAYRNDPLVHHGRLSARLLGDIV
jgi:alpha-beta hydrolase superfamily lysophospholipase